MYRINFKAIIKKYIITLLLGSDSTSDGAFPHSFRSPMYKGGGISLADVFDV